MKTQTKNRTAVVERRVIILIHSAIAGASIAAILIPLERISRAAR